MVRKELKIRLFEWYQANRRDLPWRMTRDPYAIWLSETMLQQTTTQAVVPYYERFLKRFSDVAALAAAPIEDVMELWSGLGYYSRARNLHRAAQILAQEFPQTFEELLELPGFGPYTSRAVASLAFGQSTGVLDGNVIRFLSRFHDLPLEWWRPKVRTEFQSLADQWVGGLPSGDMNQALMEMGAVLCLPRTPACTLCPLQKNCLARKRGTIDCRPLKRARRERETWVWQPRIIKRGGRILVCRGSATPFLKNHWILPGIAKRVRSTPQNYDFRHSITHHDIFVTVQLGPSKLSLDIESEQKWLLPSELSRHVPTSLVQKALTHCDRVGVRRLPLREGQPDSGRNADSRRRASAHDRRR